jgi:hypothetical protein
MAEEKLELSTKECMNLQEERDRLEAHRHERMLSQNEINEVSLELEAQRAESLRLQRLLADMRRELNEAPNAIAPELSLSAVGDNMAPHKVGAPMTSAVVCFLLAAANTASRARTRGEAGRYGGAGMPTNVEGWI